MTVLFVIREPVERPGGATTWNLAGEPFPPFGNAIYDNRTEAERVLDLIKKAVPPPFPQARIFEEEV